jgi:hypothetical protein
MSPIAFRQAASCQADEAAIRAFETDSPAVWSKPGRRNKKLPMFPAVFNQ